jgi:hypothetical protein
MDLALPELEKKVTARVTQYGGPRELGIFPSPGRRGRRLQSLGHDIPDDSECGGWILPPEEEGGKER